MKLSAKIFVLMIFINLLKGQERDVINITNDSLNYANPVIPFQPENVPAYNNYTPAFFIAETKTNNSVNLVMFEYSVENDSFIISRKITGDNFINRNASARIEAWNRKGYIIWESNKNGNFDIYAKSKSKDSSDWSDTFVLANSSANEIYPKLSFDLFYSSDETRFTYESEGTIYLNYIRDSLETPKIIFKAADEISYHKAQAFTSGWDLKTLVITEKDSASVSKSLVIKSIRVDGTPSIESTLIKNVISWNFNRLGYDYGGIFVRFSENGVVKQKQFAISSNNNYLNEELDFTSKSDSVIYLDAFVYPIITRNDLDLYLPYVYKSFSNDSTFINVDELVEEPYSYSKPVTINLKLKSSVPIVGSFEWSDYGVISYAIWADSLGNKTQLFGAKRYDTFGDVENKNQTPNNFVLKQNYPNPFNPTTSIEYSVPSNEYVSLKVYDILGREIATLVSEQKSAGSYEVKFDGSNLSSGVYFYKLNAGNYNQVMKMILLK